MDLYIAHLKRANQRLEELLYWNGLLDYWTDF